MDYMSLMQNRHSARGFMNKPVSDADYNAIAQYFNNGCQRLFPDQEAEIVMASSHVAADLKLAATAGYEQNLIGAPAYFVILSKDSDEAVLNASFMAQDMVLKLMEMGLGSCYITFADGERIKAAMGIESDKKAAIMVAFGYEERLAKKMRFKLLTMAKIGLAEKRHYYDPKKSVTELLYIHKWGNKDGMDEMIGYYDNILGEALYAASLSPSYLNRQPYSFIAEGAKVTLVSETDSYTDKLSELQNLGIVMYQFQMAATEVIGSHVNWTMCNDKEDLAIPADARVVAKINI